MGVWMVWLVGPSPPRAYPALLSVLWAPLARAPFAVRKGRIRVCLVDLRGLIADLYLIVGRGHLDISFPFNEGEAEVCALSAARVHCKTSTMGCRS